jgi:predicted lipid-binding transport protein (Tim44 family)
MNAIRRIVPHACRGSAKLAARYSSRGSSVPTAHPSSCCVLNLTSKTCGQSLGRTIDSRLYSSSASKRTEADEDVVVSRKVSEAVDEIPQEDPRSNDEFGESSDRGAIGGFMRGLMGGRDVAAEDAFVAEAKEQGIELPPPPPPRRADLVAVKRRRRRDEEDAEEEQSIRDRLFSRFAGSAFMRGAFDAKDRIAERIDESNNPIINLFRNMYDRIFAENEMAMVVREIREEDSSFTVSEFLRHAEAELIPRILSAYLAGDRDKLSTLCTEDACRMLNASIREREAEGIVMDTNILDISDVELTAGRLLEDAPVLIVTFSAQQINCLRDNAGIVIEGAVDDIRAVYYVWAFVREVELEEHVPTGGGLGADSQAESSASPDGKASNSQTSSADGKTETPTPALPPWKMMEMVIRGAHSTI